MQSDKNTAVNHQVWSGVLEMLRSTENSLKKLTSSRKKTPKKEDSRSSYWRTWVSQGTLKNINSIRFAQEKFSRGLCLVLLPIVVLDNICPPNKSQQLLWQYITRVITGAENNYFVNEAKEHNDILHTAFKVWKTSYSNGSLWWNRNRTSGRKLGCSHWVGMKIGHGWPSRSVTRAQILLGDHRYEKCILTHSLTLFAIFPFNDMLLNQRTSD